MVELKVEVLTLSKKVAEYIPILHLGMKEEDLAWWDNAEGLGVVFNAKGLSFAYGNSEAILLKKEGKYAWTVFRSNRGLDSIILK
jgi:hypothetical protein